MSPRGTVRPHRRLAVRRLASRHGRDLRAQRHRGNSPRRPLVWWPLQLGGTVNGAIVTGTVSDGPVMIGVSSFWQTTTKAPMILAAVVVDQSQQRLQQRLALQRQAAIGR